MALKIIKHTFSDPPSYYLVISSVEEIPGFTDIPANHPYHLFSFLEINLTCKVYSASEYQAYLDQAELYRHSTSHHHYSHVISLNEDFERFIDTNKDYPVSLICEVFLHMLKKEVESNGILLKSKHYALLLLNEIAPYIRQNTFFTSDIIDKIISVSGDDVKPLSDTDYVLISPDHPFSDNQNDISTLCKQVASVAQASDNFHLMPFTLRFSALKKFREWVPKNVDAIKHLEETLYLDICELYFFVCCIDDYLSEQAKHEDFVHCCAQLMPPSWQDHIQLLLNSFIDRKTMVLNPPFTVRNQIILHCLTYLHDPIYNSADDESKNHYLYWLFIKPHASFYQDICTQYQKPVNHIVENLDIWFSGIFAFYYEFPRIHRMKQLPRIIRDHTQTQLDSPLQLQTCARLFSHALKSIKEFDQKETDDEELLNEIKKDLFTLLFVDLNNDELIRLVLENVKKRVVNINPAILNAFTDDVIYNYAVHDPEVGFKIYVTPGVSAKTPGLTIENFRTFWSESRCSLIFAVGKISQHGLFIEKDTPDFPAYFLNQHSKRVAQSDDEPAAIRVYKQNFDGHKCYVCFIPRPDYPPLVLSKKRILFIHAVLQKFKGKAKFLDEDGHLVISTHCFAGLNRSPTLAAIIANMLKLLSQSSSVSAETAINYVREIATTSSRLLDAGYRDSYNTIIHSAYEPSVCNAIATLLAVPADQRTQVMYTVTQAFNLTSQPQMAFFQKPSPPPTGLELRLKIMHKIEKALTLVNDQFAWIIEQLESCTFNSTSDIYIPSKLECFLYGSRKNDSTQHQTIIKCYFVIESIKSSLKGEDRLDRLEELQQRFHEIISDIPFFEPIITSKITTPDNAGNGKN